MPVTPPAYTAGQRVTAGLLTVDLPGEYRDEMNCPGFAETCPRWACSNTTGITSGKLNLMPVYLQAGQVVGTFSWGNCGTAAVTPTHQWAGLYNSAYAQVAVTADRTSTAIGANSAFNWGVATIASGAATSYTATYSGLYYAGLMISATTMPNPVASAGAIPAPINGFPPQFGGSDTAQAAPPAFPHTAATPSAGGTSYIYMFLS
jgi:hypothetical protein